MKYPFFNPVHPAMSSASSQAASAALCNSAQDVAWAWQLRKYSGKSWEEGSSNARCWLSRVWNTFLVCSWIFTVQTSQQLNFRASYSSTQTANQMISKFLATTKGTCEGGSERPTFQVTSRPRSYYIFKLRNFSRSWLWLENETGANKNHCPYIHVRPSWQLPISFSGAHKHNLGTYLRV